MCKFLFTGQIQLYFLMAPRGLQIPGSPRITSMTHTILSNPTKLTTSHKCWNIPKNSVKFNDIPVNLRNSSEFFKSSYIRSSLSNLSNHSPGYPQTRQTTDELKTLGICWIIGSLFDSPKFPRVFCEGKGPIGAWMLSHCRHFQSGGYWQPGGKGQRMGGTGFYEIRISKQSLIA